MSSLTMPFIRRRLQRQVAADTRSVFNAPDRKTAEAHLTAIIYMYDNRIPRLTSSERLKIRELGFAFATRKEMQTDSKSIRTSKDTSQCWIHTPDLS